VQKLRALERWNSDCAEAVRWVKANRDKFRMEIMLPACLSCAVPKEEYLDAVESLFSANSLQV
jgi:hypothetical protein